MASKTKPKVEGHTEAFYKSVKTFIKRLKADACALPVGYLSLRARLVFRHRFFAKDHA
jgi:hypothetical protein